MVTRQLNDESFVERNEVFFPYTDLIDEEPHYNNFTAIQNALQHDHERRQTNITTHYRSHSSNDQYRAIRTQIEPSSLHHFYSNQIFDINSQNSFKSSNVPINIQSKKIDGHIFNLTKIVQDIGYNVNSPFMRSSTNSNTKNVSALLDIVLKMGGAHGPLKNVWRSHINDDYFQRWYLEKYYQRSASLNQHNIIKSTNKETTKYGPKREYKSKLYIDNLVSTNVLPKEQMMNESYYQNDVKQTHGYDQMNTMNTTSNQSLSNGIESKTNGSSNYERSLSTSSLTSILKKSNNNNNGNSQTKPRVTIREQYPTNEFNQVVSSQQTNQDDQRILSEYQQLIQNYPDLNNDPNPQMIRKPNSDEITYQQNVSVRYLVPPTPPPPGPLIIREVVPPRAPTPPPVVIKYQEPPPATPPPLILREAPPPPPPQQEPTIITKILPPEPPSAPRVIVEHNPPLPPKPQPVIIEKWLPYKPAPPREVIYQRVVENPVSAEFQTAATHTQRQRRHSAEFQSNSSRVPIPVNVQRRNSINDLNQEYIVEQPSGTYNELAWKTQQQLLALQQRNREQLQAHQQWAANQWQQHANMFLQYPTQLPITPLVAYQPSVTMNRAAYVQRHEYRQQHHRQQYHQQHMQYSPAYVYPYV
ncbi:unnamed protein product [Rotaria sp. Silwood1]|nr:unnamed protein product [Rotaria sp. Silwood1]CAF0934699.1 unnamed protein product [Rotaria sp. Silwood1]CAF3433194.1 unnamed protein product [Rotaria sp. Silwood1]CAF4687881.1 unnamed protein product [Rotaria sp. Silwood1]